MYESPNVEVTGAARLYRAASAWTVELAWLQKCQETPLSSLNSCKRLPISVENSLM